MAQDMLENEDSPYYDMVVSAVEAADHHKIKTFGINFGWNCLTVGAGQIRDYEKAHGHNVPWELTLHIGSGPHDMDAQEYAALLGQAKALGIYTYFLFPDAGGAAVQTALLLAESEPDCDFFLFLPAGSPAEDARLRQLDNVLIAVDSSGAGWREAALSLREGGCLYAVYRRYASRKEAEDIASGLWAERILPFAGMVAICVAGPDCSMADAAPGLPLCAGRPPAAAVPAADRRPVSGQSGDRYLHLGRQLFCRRAAGRRADRVPRRA